MLATIYDSYECEESQFGNIEVIVASAHDITNFNRMRIADLLPNCFTPDDLRRHAEQHSSSTSSSR